MPDHPPRHALTPHAAHVLAAQLREQGVYCAGKDVLAWRFETIRKAIAWLDRIHRASSWAEYMGADLPPPSLQSWLPYSARGPDQDRAGS